MVDLSVVIATKNEQEYIGKTLQSLTSSADEAEKLNIRVELIVVDSSDDNTLEIAKTFTSRAYYLPSQGVSKARNYGAKLSEGRILIFMDADTIVQKNTLIDISQSLQDESVVSVIAYVLPERYAETTSSEKLFYLIDKLFIKACGAIGFLIKFYNRGDVVAIKKPVFEKIEGFNEKLYMMEITDLLVNGLKYGRVKVLSTPVFDSCRRLRKWGLIKSYKIWWRNYFSFYLLKHLHDAKYEAVR